MRKFVVALLLLGACRSAGTPTPGTTGGKSATGASSARAAVDGFLGAVRAQDLQAMSGFWGRKQGPARDAIPRDELEKRELIMQCYLTHDRYRVVNEMSGEAGRRVIRVALSRGEVTRETNFTTIEGPAQRWYVEEVDLGATADLAKGCR
ncbi:MAG: hypothetical protein ACJ79S_03595 [Gemmatimonadaceae bacterium]